MGNPSKQKTPAKPPTSFDVARLAGVSQSSVSRVYNKNWGSRVGDDIREKVLRAAKALNYRPNAIARSLTVSKSRIIGVVVGNEFNIFYHHLLTLLTNALQQLDMRIMVINIAPGSDLNQVIFDLQDYQVDGIVITGAALTNRISSRAVENGRPLVLLNLHSDENPCSSVCCDNFGASKMMAEHLIAGGCKRFVYVSAADSPYMNHAQRQEGFLAGLEACGAGGCDIAVGDYTYRSGMAAARRVLAAGKKPDAIFCANEQMALGVMDVARLEFGLRVPQDVAVAGYDDSFATGLLSYDLTAVHQPVEKMTEDTVALLMRQIQTGDLRHETICEPMGLVVRSSTRR